MLGPLSRASTPEPTPGPWASFGDSEPIPLRLHLLPGRHEGWSLFSEATHETWRRQREAARLARDGRTEKPTWRERLDHALHWMRQRGSASERALRELRQPESVEVVYPAALSEPEVRKVWRQMLADLVRRHRRLLLVHGSLLPLGALATVVPGPNVWFVYLAWRTLAHWRSAQGGRRALGELPVRFTPEPGLDPLVELMDRRVVLRRKEKIRALGERLGIRELDAAY